MIGPVLLQVVGDEYVESANVELFLWEGVTTAGDSVEVRCRQTNALLFVGRALGPYTYEGLGLDHGLSAPYGFRLTTLAAGRVLVYLRGSR